MESAGAVNCCTKRVCVCVFVFFGFFFFQEELVGFPPRCRCTRQDAPAVVAVFALFFFLQTDRAQVTQLKGESLFYWRSC